MQSEKLIDTNKQEKNRKFKIRLLKNPVLARDNCGYGELLQLIRKVSSIFDQKCQESAMSGSFLLKLIKLDDMLSHHAKQEQTTWTKGLWQNLKA